MLVGRGALRNPWIFQQATALAAGEPVDEVTDLDRGRFLLDYIDMLLRERVDETDGFRHTAPGDQPTAPPHARGRARWVINKLRALGSWYTKGLHSGSTLRTAINRAESIDELRAIITEFFDASDDALQKAYAPSAMRHSSSPHSISTVVCAKS